MAHWVPVDPRFTLLAAAIGDPDGTRVVTSIIALLVALGLALAMLAVWLFRSTRPDPELLAPLEMMGERKWRRADPVWQRRRLDDLRPDDAEPLAPSAAPPDVDEAFDAGPSAPGFDDLHDVALAEFLSDLPPPTSPAVVMGGAPTPRQIDRPPHEEFSEDEIGSDALARANEHIDAALGASMASDGAPSEDAAEAS